MERLNSCADQHEALFCLGPICGGGNRVHAFMDHQHQSVPSLHGNSPVKLQWTFPLKSIKVGSQAKIRGFNLVVGWSTGSALYKACAQSKGNTLATDTKICHFGASGVALVLHLKLCVSHPFESENFRLDLWSRKLKETGIGRRTLEFDPEEGK